MKEKNLKQNMLINGIRKGFSILFPLITFPYISRVLQVDNVGVINYTNSIISYFVLIATLGINTYAVREGSQYRNDKEKMSKFASEIFTINLFSSSFAILLLIACIYCLPQLKEYSIILGISSLAIPISLIGCEWLLSIYEEYTYLAIRYILMHFFAIICMFLFVKTPGDCVKYIAITLLANSGAQLLNVPKIYRLGCRIRIRINIRHLAPVLVLFASNIATVIFTNSDMTILGMMCGSHEVGLYSVSVKIYNLLVEIIGAVIISIIPRISYYIGVDKKTEVYNILKESNEIILTLIIPAAVGVIVLSRQIIEIIAGSEYLGASSSLSILAIAFVFCIIGYFWGDGFLIPLKKEKLVLFSTVIAALINILFNFIMIPIFKRDATAFTTLLSQIVSTIILLRFVSNEGYNLRKLYQILIKIIPGSLTVYFICKGTILFVENTISQVITSVTLSIIAYFIIEMFLKNDAVLSIYYSIKNALF